jgi:hypothetical protein
LFEQHAPPSIKVTHGMLEVVATLVVVVAGVVVVVLVVGGNVTGSPDVVDVDSGSVGWTHRPHTNGQRANAMSWIRLKGEEQKESLSAQDGASPSHSG